MNCCAAIRLVLDSGPDGGNCPPGAGPCRGFAGNCGDTIAQFADLPVLPDHPNGLSDYVCTSFPDDARFIDTFLVSLLSLGAALPVSLFVLTCFDMANDGDAPANYISWSPFAWPALVWGMQAHKRWHYVRDGQPPMFVRWYARFRFWGYAEIAMDFWTRLWCTLTCAEMPWHVEAREAAEEEEEKEEVFHESSAGDDSPYFISAENAIFADWDGWESEHGGDASPITAENAIYADWDGGARESEKGAAEEEEEDEETEEDVRFKRNLTAAGFAAVYVTWVRPRFSRGAAAAAL